MSFFHANQREALNQSPAEVQGQINVRLSFSLLRTSEMEQNPVELHRSPEQPKAEVCF